MADHKALLTYIAITEASKSLAFYTDYIDWKEVSKVYIMYHRSVGVAAIALADHPKTMHNAVEVFYFK